MTRSVACIIQARCNSSRFPSKVLAQLGGKSLLSFLLNRVLRSRCIDEIIVATTEHATDDAIEEIALNLGLKCIRGSEKDVLGRYCSALNITNADILVRITGDCPLIDPSVVDSVIDLFTEGDFDYCSNILPPTFPDGYDVKFLSCIT